MNENRTMSNAPSHGVTHGATLAGEAAGLHAQMTPTDGTDGVPLADLNPRFVEALMGLPDRWADPLATVTSFISWATARSLPASRTPGDNSPTD